jgi:hypothetical protein
LKDGTCSSDELSGSIKNNIDYEKRAGREDMSIPLQNRLAIVHHFEIDKNIYLSSHRFAQ